MNLNATIVVQAVNFFVAYLLLRFFLFKPAVQIIEDELEQQNQLRLLITNNHTRIFQKERERYEQWEASHNFYEKNHPFLGSGDHYIFQHITPILPYPHVSPQTIKRLIDETSHELVKKVGHDY